MHQYRCRVYYEDTDSGGVVYYANYLKFAERARTEYIRESGINQNELAIKQNILFVVRRAELDIMRAAKLDDTLSVFTEVIEKSGAVVWMKQEIYFEKIKLCSIKVQLAVVNSDFRPIRLPDFLNKVFY